MNPHVQHNETHTPNPRQTKMVTIGWTFDAPPSTLASSKMQLLTVGGIAVTGVWAGEPGQYYVAYAPLLPVDKALFNATIESYKTATRH